jgi:hypothetical protein
MYILLFSSTLPSHSKLKGAIFTRKRKEEMNLFQIMFMLMAVMIVKTDGKNDQTAYQKRTGKIARLCI